MLSAPRPPTAHRLAPVVLAAVAALAACTADRSVAPGALDAGKGVVLSAADVQLLLRTPSAAPGARGGTSRALDAVLLKRNGKPQKKDEDRIAWTSLDPRVATVSETGVVTAQDLGRTFVVASYKDRTADSVVVAVVPVPVASVTISGADSIAVDDTTQLAAVARDSVGEPLEGRAFTWTSIAPAVASVDDSGAVVALAPGMATIRAAAGGREAAWPVRVTLQPVATVSVEPSAVTLPQFRRARRDAVARDRRGKVLTGRDGHVDDVGVRGGVDPRGQRQRHRARRGRGHAHGHRRGTVGHGGRHGRQPGRGARALGDALRVHERHAVDFAKIATIMQKAASARFNVVYFQVRTAGDALYYSDLEPCSPRMCGTLGGPRPAQDPLVVALREAAKHGIEVHAWVNALTGFIAGSTTACNQFIASTPANWLKAHPEWSVSTKNFTTGVITRQVDNCLAPASTCGCRRACRRCARSWRRSAPTSPGGTRRSACAASTSTASATRPTRSRTTRRRRRPSASPPARIPRPTRRRCGWTRGAAT
jgi:hypothetical protein